MGLARIVRVGRNKVAFVAPMLLAVSTTCDGEAADRRDRSSGALGICLLPAYIPVNHAR